MRIRGGHIFSAKRRVAGFAGWARSALALAMALFFVAQGTALHAQGARSNHGAAIGQKCERSDAALPGRETRPPATEVQHDCEACLACVFASIIDARPRFLAPPVPAKAIAAAFPDDFSTPVPRWRASPPARAPPLFS